MMSIMDMSRADRLRRAGCVEQLYGIRQMTLSEGRAKGASVWEAETGGGLTLDVLPDNALDLGRLRYKGTNISFLAKNGLTSQHNYDPQGFGQNFFAGMMYTCGLMNAGGGSQDGDTWHAAHGRVHFIASEYRQARVDEEKGELVMEGRVRESELFGYAMQIDRKITLPIGGSTVTVEDAITNTTPDDTEFMLLYHFNFGYPFLDDSLRLILPEGTITTPRTPRAAEGMHEFTRFTAPQDDFPEQVYFHDLPDPTVRAENDKLGVGIALTFDKATTPLLAQWKSMKSTDYALGLEPTNNYISGRAEERKNGTLKHIGGFETIRTRVSLHVYDL